LEDVETRLLRRYATIEYSKKENCKTIIRIIKEELRDMASGAFSFEGGRGEVSACNILSRLCLLFSHRDIPYDDFVVMTY
jgi:hypothetical protein